MSGGGGWNSFEVVLRHPPLSHYTKQSPCSSLQHTRSVLHDDVVNGTSCKQPAGCGQHIRLIALDILRYSTGWVQQKV